MSIDWKKFETESGTFKYPEFLYKTLNGLMKYTLDLGTMLSNDPAKTRAFKEQIKSEFKREWLNVAQTLEYFEIIVPCECFDTKEYCKICGGSRYQLADGITPSIMREIGFVTKSDDDQLTVKLQRGLEKAIVEVEQAGFVV